MLPRPRRPRELALASRPARVLITSFAIAAFADRSLDHTPGLPLASPYWRYARLEGTVEHFLGNTLGDCCRRASPAGAVISRTQRCRFMRRR